MYILILFLTYVLHLLLKLNWVCTAVVLVFLLVMQHFHRIKGQRFQEARKRFLDVSLYIDTLLYSFLKEQKIIRAFEDVKSTLADGHMKETWNLRLVQHFIRKTAARSRAAVSRNMSGRKSMKAWHRR